MTKWKVCNMNKLYNEDFYAVVEKLKDGSIDLIITDPPYKFDSKGGGFYADNNSTKREYAQKLMDLKCCDFDPIAFLDAVKPKMKKFYAYVFCNKTLVEDYIHWARTHKCSYDILVMAKSNPIPAYNNHYVSDLEYIIVIREKGTYFSKEKNLDLYRKWFMTSCKKNPLHPAEKPKELIERFVKVASKEGDTVFDPFMGSGTTGVVCRELKRDFLGCEIDDKYFNLAKNRIEHGE